jgi:GT2 family glycosyltransferase
MLIATRLAELKRWLWLINRRRLNRRQRTHRVRYDVWCQRHDTLDEATRAALDARLADLPAMPRITVRLALDGASVPALNATFASLLAQGYPAWRLELTGQADGAAASWAAATAAADARVSLGAWGSSDAATRWWVLATAGDIWRAHALLLLAEAAVHSPAAQLIYADHDRLDAHGQRCEPAFLCDWNPELLLADDCIGPAALWRAERVSAVLAAGVRGPHDLALRASCGLPADAMVHVPHVLVHRATGARAVDADADAVAAHLGRLGLRGSAALTPAGVRVRWALPEPAPRVSIVIPTRNQLELLRACIDSIRSLTDYPDFEIVIVDNGSDDPTCLRYLQDIAGTPGVRVLRDARPFNYAELNNAAVAQCSGEFIALLNNDIEVIAGGWLREMVSLAALPDTGAVGARLLYGDRSVQHAGVFLGLGGGAGHGHKGLGEFDGGHLGRALQLQSVSAVSAACLVVRRAHYEAIGGLDAAAFAVAFNDVDFCLRLRARGLRNLYTPHAVLLHHESVTRGRDGHAARRPRFESERATFRARWGHLLERDPAYNPNLTLRAEDFSLADPPRVSLLRSWRHDAPPVSGLCAAR